MVEQRVGLVAVLAAFDFAHKNDVVAFFVAAAVKAFKRGNRALDQRRAMLAGVRTVIVDEIHALAPTKRGAHLAIALDPSLTRDAAMEHIRKIAEESREIARIRSGMEGVDPAIQDELAAAVDAVSTVADDPATPDRLRGLLRDALESLASMAA